MQLFNRKSAIAAAVLSATLASSAWAAQTASQAVSVLKSQGYEAVYDLKAQHGHWTAKGTTQSGTQVRLLINASNQVTEVGNPLTQHQIATKAQATARLSALGYTNVRDVELEDGFWEADARNRAGREVEVFLHPVTLAVAAEVVKGGSTAGNTSGSAPAPAPAPTPNPGTGGLLTQQQIQAALLKAGYTNLHDFEFKRKNNYWEVDATNRRGQRVELRVDAYTGKILRERYDD